MSPLTGSTAMAGGPAPPAVSSLMPVSDAAPVPTVVQNCAVISAPLAGGAVAAGRGPLGGPETRLMVYCAWSGAGFLPDVASTTYWPLSGSVRNPPDAGICESAAPESLKSTLWPSGP